MQYGGIEHPQSGLLTPLSSIRTRSSLGIGEYADLPMLAEWAKSAGFDLLQLLPLQDTGEDASPYAACGAFSLHPIHLRIQDIDGAEHFSQEISDLIQELNAEGKTLYTEVLQVKWRLLRELFDRKDPVELWGELAGFIDENPWIRPHAVHQMLRRRNQGRPWWQWDEFVDPLVDEVAELWSNQSTELLYEVWVQCEADRQLRAATYAVDELGMKLKGDLPILMDRGSSDVWFYRRFFDQSGLAGAPPDMYARTGQLWGFPCYRWDELEADGYRWWKQRLQVASRYYHALRIDHVLGFFRIWRSAVDAPTAMLGHFDPSPPVTRDELLKAGLSYSTIDGLASLSPDAQVPQESELFDPELSADEQIESLTPAWQQVLLPCGNSKDEFRFAWQWRERKRFEELKEPEQNALRHIAEIVAERQEALWEKTGRDHLAMLGGATDALLCAEDLGATTQCVFTVLEELGILGLRVERWSRHWDQPQQPFIAPSEFPADSICSPGLHDASSLRAWWEETSTDRQAYWHAMGKKGEAPRAMNEDLLREVIERNLAAGSKICVLALPDVLALSEAYRPEDPTLERINIPGTPSKQNWHWRMQTTIEGLLADTEFTGMIGEMNARRRARDLA